MAVFRSRGTMPVVRDVLMMFVMVGKRMSRFVRQRSGGNGIEFTRLGRCTFDYFQQRDNMKEECGRGWGRLNK